MKAAAYEKAQTLAMTELSQKLAQNEKTRAAIQAEMAHIHVNIETSTPAVTYSYYDPAGPKPPLVSDDWNGSATCDFKFDASFTVHTVKRSPDEPFDFHFDAVRISLGLVIIITLPNGEAGKLKDHEKGHRKIDEYFYSIGPQAAQRASETLTDNELLSYESNSESAKMDVIGKTRFNNLESEYLKQTQGLCEQANKYYDELTDHGRNNMDSDQAAQTAIRRYEPQPPN
jgi:hypothetical protein